MYLLPAELDEEVATIKLRAMGFDVDKLSEEQWKYLHEA
ncbi:MAG: adenosylhomocysteinase [Succiniclasticum sp.]|nr:adenosylhomocysteinase [Succiniclasticum sp.]